VCQDLESGFYEDVFPWQQLKQHDAASLLKKFIRELPHPLLTVKYLNAFISVDSRWSLAASVDHWRRQFNLCGVDVDFSHNTCVKQHLLYEEIAELDGSPLKLFHKEVDKNIKKLDFCGICR